MGGVFDVFCYGIYIVKMKRIEVNNGWYIFIENFFETPKSEALHSYFINKLPWKSGEIKLFGKVYPIPRKEVYFSDNKLSYSYSGKELIIDVWDENVLEIKGRVEALLNVEFNACLSNLYRNGQDSNGWHADNEKELGKNPIIASVSFGATRRFDLRHQSTKEKLSFQLTSGSLLVMGGEMQHFWKHQIPKQKNVNDPRVNLTFRQVLDMTASAVVNI
jgi:alkylated DNA repair dioxygenase AlkB